MLEANNLLYGSCVIDSASRVIRQNAACRALCGVQKGGLCTAKRFRACQLDRQLLSEGRMSLFRSQTLRSPAGVFDVCAMAVGELLYIQFLDVSQHLNSLLELVPAGLLTERESEILTLRLRGLKRSEICALLHITQNTLKTHVRNLIRKLPPALREKMAAT